ncbi:hypothetical protein [Nocardioides sp. Root140]|uniref:hypothetical protein n=1 Tax=Nocardioides sp. Root140 TaxID=1736460 RepID=UPI0012E383B5|nr:hypothetical protein [Nocardioides sp. Root140]
MKDDAGGGPDHVLQAFEVVQLYPEFGPGAAVRVSGARRLGQGQIQILVEGYPCGVPTRVDLAETNDEVSLTVFAARHEAGDCPANTIPWFVQVELKSALGTRAIKDTTTATRVQLVDCNATPTHPWCKSVDSKE